MVGRNSRINFWHDYWMNRGPLRQLIQGPFTQEASFLEVKDIMVDMSWDLGEIPFELPIEIKQMIQAVPATIISRGVDKLA